MIPSVSFTDSSPFMQGELGCCRSGSSLHGINEQSQTPEAFGSGEVWDQTSRLRSVSGSKKCMTLLSKVTWMVAP